MPPLCTAGYGLATWQLDYFLGAFYLFLINTVFIALATLITARLLKFPFKVHPDDKEKTRVNRIVWAIALVTLLPSIYFGYDIVKQNNFQKKANQFVENEAVFPNNFLLKKVVDANSKEIILTYGGLLIKDSAILDLNSKLGKYDLADCNLKIQQGFSYLNETSKNNEQDNLLSSALNEKAKQIEVLSYKLDSIYKQKDLSKQVYKEIKAQHPSVESLILQPTILTNDSIQKNVWISNVKSTEKLNAADKTKMQEWLKVRLNTEEIFINFEN